MERWSQRTVQPSLSCGGRVWSSQLQVRWLERLGQSVEKTIQKLESSSQGLCVKVHCGCWACGWRLRSRKDLLKASCWPWLVWLSGLSASLRTKGSSVQFSVYGTCLGCSQVPSRGVCERQPHIDVSLPLFLSPFPSLKINKIFKKWHTRNMTGPGDGVCIVRVKGQCENFQVFSRSPRTAMPRKFYILK